MKEALYLQMIPSEERFNHDGGLEVPGCWTAAIRTQKGRPIFIGLQPPMTCILSACYKLWFVHILFITFSQMRTEAFSQNINKTSMSFC